MSKLSSDGKYVTVEKGDSLWSIAEERLGSGSKYPQLRSWNNISSNNIIYVGQKIYLSKQGASSSGSSSTSTKKSTSNSNKVSITHFGLQSNTDSTLFVTWNWTKSNTASYLVEWTYFTRDGVWFVGSSETKNVDSNSPAASRQSIYDIPVNAVKVRVRIKPISKKKTVNKKETNYWTASWSSYKTYSNYGTLATPSAPTIEINKFKLTATLENITADEATSVQFQLYKNDGNSVYKTGKSSITGTKTASWSVTVDAGEKYKVRCRFLNAHLHSEWSNFSQAVTTIPKAPAAITELKALSETSIFVDWDSVSNADTYEIQYTTKKTYFDSSNEVQTGPTIDAKVTDHAEITGLTSGEEYFFRVRACNEQGNSAWSPIKSIIIGKKPSAPTTWSSTTTAISGEDITLYWVHNSVDNSSETTAELELIVNGKPIDSIITIKNTTKEEDKDKTSSVVIDTDKNTVKWTEDSGNKTHTIKDSKGNIVDLSDGVKIQWRIRTAGITKQYGDWSAQRTIDIYAPPTLELAMTDVNEEPIETLKSFPFYIYGLPGPVNQAPVSYHVSIVANESYVTVDNVGNEKIVTKGDEVYSEFYDTTQAILLELMPHSVDLENGISYTINCIVSMNSGLTAEATYDFDVSWTDEIYTPNAEIGYNEDTYTTQINPYCTNAKAEYRVVTRSGLVFNVSDEVIADEDLDGIFTETGELVCVGKFPNNSTMYYCVVYTDENGNDITPVYHMVKHDTENGNDAYIKLDTTTTNPRKITSYFSTTGELVEKKLTSDGRDIYCCLVETIDYVEDVTLSVYRREYDGRFMEIATGLNNSNHTYVTDPHPSLDYARYRIVAISNKTGAVSFYDVPGYPINEIGAIIQWDEDWSVFDTTEEAELEQPPWTGSLLRLLYNIDVSDATDPDVAHANYIGRSHPVAYYGTQLGVTSTWKMEILKSDVDTLYALRRLMIYNGGVYVREPSGSGYWATVKVSFSQTHCELTIPVSLNITRVEGGV